MKPLRLQKQGMGGLEREDAGGVKARVGVAGGVKARQGGYASLYSATAPPRPMETSSHHACGNRPGPEKMRAVPRCTCTEQPVLCPGRRKGKNPLLGKRFHASSKMARLGIRGPSIALKACRG